MKAIISNRIFLQVTSAEDRIKIKKATTYKIPLPPSAIRPGMPQHRTIKNYKELGNNIISIPVGRMELIPEGFELVDKRVKIEAQFPEFKGILRDSQAEIVDQVNSNCIINAPPSWGKTFAAIRLASMLKVKTLVILSTTVLRDQWAEEINKTLGIKAGIIGSGKFNIDAPIVVGNIQTLYKVIPKIQDQFGLVILDECHRVSAKTVSDLLDSMQSYYKIGLSATLVRKDGEHVVFPDYFGHKVFKAEKENSMMPKVIVIETGISLDYSEPSFAAKVTALQNNKQYLSIIANTASSLVSKGYKPLIPMSRTESIASLAEVLTRFGVVTGGNPTGRDLIYRAITDEKLDGLIATQSIVSEGFSLNILSALILSTPINNESLLEQLIGRIIREYLGKQQPIVVDLRLCCPTGRSQFTTRLGVYLKLGYEVEYITL